MRVVSLRFRVYVSVLNKDSRLAWIVLIAIKAIDCAKRD
jgi:hypothetical protein